ncbi:hypothetical protein [Dactylosporangium salmoneum]|uniref:Uncharacterized protein n=1 Tax=Dactylosporangium salmoneum TaxID=53361 RepID=A0ABP5UXR1_9ACTN
MARQGWGLIVVMAAALIVYLVMPDQIDATAVVHAGNPGPGATSVIDPTHDGSGQLVLCSDQLTTPPRATCRSLPAAADRDIPLASGAVSPNLGADQPPGWQLVNPIALAALRSAHTALQVLRC